MENPDSQITEATLVEETKVTPKRRKSREDPVSQKPSTRDVVTAPKEITVVEKGKMSPTKRVQKGQRVQNLFQKFPPRMWQRSRKSQTYRNLQSKLRLLIYRKQFSLPTRVGSKSSDDPTAVKPVSVIVGTTDVEPQ